MVQAVGCDATTRDTSTLDLIFTDMVEYFEIPAMLAPLSSLNLGS